MSQKLWYKDWFNSPYYHILYKNRDEKEARGFMDVLGKHLQLNKGHMIWDLACGKGRHSVYLNAKGLRVIGTDLSENNIEDALSYANETLEFYVHDMRTPFRINYFTHVLNLFTSIGYFENDRDNYKVFKNVFQSLKPGGLFIIDFFNDKKVRECMVPEAQMNLEGINFVIHKNIKGNKIEKCIEFSDKGKSYYFQEKVALLSKDDFEMMAAKAGFVLQECFGDYLLNSFDKNNSDRLILIFKK
jgi:cyclopropane fatty-acyl-phospholipid synthase-like methyltransferase